MGYGNGHDSNNGGNVGGCATFILLIGILVFVVCGLRISFKTIKVSWYNPALLGTNCATVVGGECVSTTASGMNWRDGMNWSGACPPRYPFRTVFFAGSLRPWVCMDRGGAIRVLPNGTAWVDMLVTKPVYPYGTEVPGAFVYFDPIWRKQWARDLLTAR